MHAETKIYTTVHNWNNSICIIIFDNLLFEIQRSHISTHLKNTYEIYLATYFFSQSDNFFP